MTPVQPSDEDFGFIDQVLEEEGVSKLERENQTNMEPKKEREPAENSWTSIDMYYHGFHIKKSVPATISPEDLKKGIEEYEKLDFQPSWNPDTNKAAKDGVVQKTETVQNAPICGVHGTQMVWKEGVSKTTHKPYAFWSCPTKNADNSFCGYKPPKV